MGMTTSRKLLTLCMATVLTGSILLTSTACSSQPDVSKGTPSSPSKGQSQSEMVTESAETGTQATVAATATDATVATKSSSGQGGEGPLKATKTSGKKVPTTKNRPTAKATQPSGTYNPYPRKSELKGKTVKVLLWFTPSENEQAIIDSFENEFQAKVEVVVTTYGDYQTKMTTMISGKDLVDVAVMHPHRFPSMFIGNLVQPLDNCHFDLKNDPIYDIEQMDPYIWNGKYMGVNLKGSDMCHDLTVMMYNKTIFKNCQYNPGTLFANGQWNWDTFYKAAQEVTDPGKKQYGYGAGDKRFFLLSAGADFVKVDNSGGKTKFVSNLDDPNLLKGILFYRDVRDKGYDPSDNDSLGDFISGKCAMYAHGQYVMMKGSQIARRMTDDWGVVPFPSPKSGKDAILATKARLWCVGQGVKDTLPASYFIRYYCDPAYSTDNVSWFEKSEFKDVFAKMTDIKKFSGAAEGIVGYSSINDYYKLQNDILYSPPDQMATTIQGMKPYLNDILKNVQSKNK